MFLKKMMPSYLSVLESNLTARDQKGITEEGHKIKGAAGSIGLKHLQQLANRSNLQNYLHGGIMFRNG